jgi:acyl carrier protein
MAETTEAALNDAKVATDAFPDAEVEACLAAELIEAAKSEAEIKEIDLPQTTAGLRAMQIAIDSLVVVDLLVSVEPILGFELKDSIVRQGGYASVEDAVSHLLPRIQKEWMKRKGKKV